MDENQVSYYLMIVMRIRSLLFLFVILLFSAILLFYPAQEWVYADSSETNDDWPMFHGNVQHTGQSPFNGPQTNNLKWKYTRDDITEGSMPNSFSVDKNGIVYVTAADKLLALSPEGELLWSADLAGTGATAISPDGITLYAVGGTNLYAFTTSGEALWTYEEPTENIYGEPCVASDGTIYCGSWDTYVYALNPDGTLKWKYQTDGAIAPLASPTLSNDEATIYVGSGDPNKDNGGTLYAIDAEGTLQWKIENLDQMRVSGAVVGPDGRVYVCASGRVHCFSPDGTKVWESERDTAGSLTPSLSSDGTIYVGTAKDGKVYAIDASNGQTKWSYQTGINPDYDPDNPMDPPYGVLSTPVIEANGIVYVGAMDGVMHALKPDGSVLWTYQTGDNINENCPATGPDGTLYFSSADKYIYAIKDTVSVLDYIVVFDSDSYHVAITTNSSISNLAFNQPLKQISFNVSGLSGASGYCNVTIPIELLSGTFTVLFDGTSISYTLTQNSTHSSIYFEYTHSVQEIQIIGTTVIPEFPSIITMPLLLIALAILLIFLKKRINSTTCEMKSSIPL
ncbi:MAG: PQQ-binding-like beta-propeller repeat protein [Candidatus Bathyarchaeia archaeon]